MFKKKLFIYPLLTLFLIGCSLYNSDPQSEDEMLISAVSEEAVYSIQTEDPEFTLESEKSEIFLFERNVNLDSWVGEYVYIDGPPKELVDSIVDSPVSPKYVIYELHIRECSGILDLYYAELGVNGWMTGFNAFTFIQGNDEEISVLFFDHMPVEIQGYWKTLKRGDVLFKLRKSEDGIVTEWSEIFDYNSDKNATFIKSDDT